MGDDTLSQDEVDQALKSVEIQMENLPTSDAKIHKVRDGILEELQNELNTLKSIHLNEIVEFCRKKQGFREKAKAIIVEQMLCKTQKEALRSVKILKDELEDMMKNSENILIQKVRDMSTNYMKKLNNGLNSHYREAVEGLEEDFKLKSKQEKITEMLGLQGDVPDTPPVFPTDFNSLVFSAVIPYVIREKKISRHFWHWFWLVDYIEPRVVGKKKIFAIPHNRLRARMEEHCKDRNEVLFQHFEMYFKSVFTEKSTTALDFISHIFSGAHENLKRKKAQMEDKKRNVQETQESIQQLKGSILQNTKKHA
eukprot:TRINITY_DN4795_c0_g1_i6.p1 TRINITY_DN4795_c0_g1~~TRINITY_DN4795_c0_g1_i6.p1  ORF type:complete len:359 (-),score=98.18 TRINITY_DN4795_c0_g1_i6:320-1249(-)